MEDYLNSLVPQPEPETYLSEDQKSEIARRLDQIELYLERLKKINEDVEAIQTANYEDEPGYSNQKVKDHFNDQFIRKINDILDAIEYIYDTFIHKNRYSVSDQYREWYRSVKSRGLLLYEAYPRCMILFIK